MVELDENLINPKRGMEKLSNHFIFTTLDVHF